MVRDLDAWHALAIVNPPEGATTFEKLAQYAMSFNGYDYAEQVLKNDDLEGYIDAHCRKGGKWQGTIEELRACLFYLQRSIRCAEEGAYDEAGRKEFMEVFEAVNSKLSRD